LKLIRERRRFSALLVCLRLFWVRNRDTANGSIRSHFLTSAENRVPPRALAMPHKVSCTTTQCWTTQNMNESFSGLVMRIMFLFSCVLLITFHWTSGKPERCTCGVAIDASPDQHLISVIGPGKRFDWSDDQLHTIRVIGGSNYLLIIGLSIY
jgi:hypothetical protein